MQQSNGISLRGSLCEKDKIKQAVLESKVRAFKLKKKKSTKSCDQEHATMQAHNLKNAVKY